MDAARKRTNRKVKKKMNTATKARLILLLLVILVIGIAYVLFHGFAFGIYDIGNIQANMKYGLDLTGGVNVVMQATSDAGDVTSEEMTATVTALENRINSLGVNESTVAQQGTDRLRVSIPAIQNQQQALDMIGKTAKLEFVGPDDEVILTGDDVSSARAVQQEENGIQQYVVSLEFNASGTEKFAEATQKFQGQVISIKLDDEVISAPTVQAVISDGKAVITGMEDAEEAANLADLIQGGALPLQLSPLQVTTVGPTLGQDSLDQSILAGSVGIGLVLIFMIIIYFGLGFIADIALLIYILIDLFIIVSLGVTLTLPGIAGLILSVGMAVDANVIIFERIKDEAKKGRSYLTAIDNGFDRALRTIIDSNVTTLIAGFVLYFMGSGTVQGFAVTLIIGILVSMFTAVVVTRYLIKLLVQAKIFNNAKILGI